MSKEERKQNAIMIINSVIIGINEIEAADFDEGLHRINAKEFKDDYDVTLSDDIFETT